MDLRSKNKSHYTNCNKTPCNSNKSALTCTSSPTYETFILERARQHDEGRKKQKENLSLQKQKTPPASLTSTNKQKKPPTSLAATNRPKNVPTLQIKALTTTPTDTAVSVHEKPVVGSKGGENMSRKGEIPMEKTEGRETNGEVETTEGRETK